MSDVPTSTGTKASAIAASFALVTNIKVTDSTTIMIMRNRYTSWFEMKFDIASASEVQRWIMSPVWCSTCHERGRRCMCENRLLRIPRISVWLARWLK